MNRQLLLLSVICWTFASHGMAQEHRPSESEPQQQGPKNLNQPKGTRPSS